jgi:hypothetical protein
MGASRITSTGALEVSRTQPSTPSSGLEKNENGLSGLVPFRPDSGSILSALKQSFKQQIE